MRFLIDEMFPAATCSRLLERHHDTVHVRDLGFDGRPDREVAAVAKHEQRVLVTENVKDFAGEHDLAIVCVLKSRLPAQGMAEHSARVLEHWALDHPDPYIGLHWPRTP